MRPTLISFLVGLLIGSAQIAGCSNGLGADRAPIASIEMADLDGIVQPFSRRGRISLVNFWATWCAPCIAEMPELQLLHEGHRADGLIVLGVSTDTLPESEIAAFVHELELDYPIIKDDGSAVAAAGSILGYPTTIVLDQNGKEVRRILGATTARELEQIIQELLEKD